MMMQIDVIEFLSFNEFVDQVGWSVSAEPNMPNFALGPVLLDDLVATVVSKHPIPLPLTIEPVKGKQVQVIHLEAFERLF